MSNNRVETYKTLQKQFLNKAKGKQKERVKDLLTLYKEGKIFSKVSIQRELNRYLGRFKSEDERELYYLKTMTEHIANKRTKVTDNRKNKIDAKLEKIDDIRADLLGGNEELIKK